MLLCGYSRPLLARETGWLTVLAAVLLLVAPVAADAQPPATPVIGFLGTSTAAAWAGYVAGFRQGLGEAGYVAAGGPGDRVVRGRGHTFEGSASG